MLPQTDKMTTTTMQEQKLQSSWDESYTKSSDRAVCLLAAGTPLLN